MTEKIIVTFGQKYAYEAHPSYPAAHPDLWVEVEADTVEGCYEIIQETFGQFYAFSYSEENWIKQGSAELFPRGCHEVLRKEKAL